MKDARSLIVIGLLAGCGGYTGSKSTTWPEEVEVAQGQTILVDRKTEIVISNQESEDPAKQPGRWSWVSFPDKPANPPVWKEKLLPILVYRDPVDGEWVIIATTSDCDLWSTLGRPAAPYWEYRVAGKDWRLVELSDSSIGRDSNLYLDVGGVLPKAPISMAAKSKARKVTIRREDRGTCS